MGLDNKVIIRGTLIGILFGLCFPLLGYSFDIINRNLPFTWHSIVYIHQTNPIHFIINSAPFVLGAAGFIIGNLFYRNIEKEKQVIKIAFMQDFLAKMSHEIRTPMNGIFSMVDLLRNTGLNTVQKEYAEIIYNSSSVLLKIVNEILDYSKIQAGKLIINNQVFDIKDFLNETILLFQALAKERNIKLNAHFDSSIPEQIYIDKERLSQVLYNLIGNALKFTDKGSVTLKVNTLKNSHGEVQDFLFEVIDTGRGMSDENIKNLFQEYVQFQNTQTEAAKGTGLGLVISKNIIEKLGGTINVESKLKKGSNFFFTLPIQEIPSKDTAIVEANTAEPLPQLNLNILMAEDNETNIKIAKIVFEKLGCSISFARDGLILLDMYQEKTYDVIFTDIRMPNMDGLKATKALRKKHQQLPPIIGLSAFSMEGDKEHFMQQGLDDYVSKPINIKSIIKCLQSWS